MKLLATQSKSKRLFGYHRVSKWSSFFLNFCNVLTAMHVHAILHQIPSSISVLFRSGCQASNRRYFGAKKILCQLISVLKKVKPALPSGFSEKNGLKRWTEEHNDNVDFVLKGLGLESWGYKKASFYWETIFSAIVTGPCLTSSSEEIHDFPGGTWASRMMWCIPILIVCKLAIVLL